MAIISAIFCFCLTLICPGMIQAASGFHQPGFRTMGVVRNGEHIDLNIWYPTRRSPQLLNYMPWTVTGAYGARPEVGPFPVLLISHASAGARFSYHNLAEFLASSGFVIVAPTHSHDCMNNMSDMLNWRQLSRRVEEIDSALNAILADAELAPVIDKSRIGLIGFGAGGAAALLIGGALPNCGAWTNYCARFVNDLWCASSVKRKINDMCKLFPLKSSLANPSVKALAIIAPAFGMLFDTESFQYFYPPVLLVSAGKDNLNRPAAHAEPLARVLGKKARYLELPEADATALMAPCPPLIASELPELCHSVSPETRKKLQQKLRETLLAFFSHYLVAAGNLPVIPAPPNLAPEPEPEKPAKAAPARSKRSGRQKRQ